MSNRRGVFAFCLAVLIVGSHGRADETSWQPLLGRAPADANALVMINAEKVRDSGFARKAGWNSADSAPGGLRTLLPRGEVRRVVFAARLNLADLSPRWEAGLLETGSDPSLAMFAAGVRGPHELLGSTPAVRLPIDAYLLKLAPSTFGVLGPADRQQAVAWARAAENPKPLHSAYLAKIASFPETVGTEVMLGLDLLDAVDAAVVKDALQKSPTLADAKLDIETAAPIIASIEGIALGVRVLDQATGMIRIDFGRDPTSLAAVMKPLLLERLAARGAMIEDFQSWTLEVKDRTAYLGGNLTPAGLSLILSLVEPELPEAKPDTTAATSVAPTGPPKPSVEKSVQHFKQVKQLITEVRFPSSDLKFVSAGAFGAWIDRQARRIDQLPLLGVDPELLDYSQGVAKSLRVTAAKQRGATIGASAYSTRRYRYTDDDTGQSYVSESQNQIQSRMENSAANLSHVEVMRMLDDETAEMRRRMTERYGVEF